MSIKTGQHLFGMNVYISDHAVTTIKIFPDKKRTKRRRRRLLGKWKTETRTVPAMFIIGEGFNQKIVIHSAKYEQLKNQFQED